MDVNKIVSIEQDLRRSPFWIHGGPPLLNDLCNMKVSVVQALVEYLVAMVFQLHNEFMVRGDIKLSDCFDSLRANGGGGIDCKNTRHTLCGE